MILGRLRTKKRKGQVSADYLIHVKQIAPWHISQTQNPEETVSLQWEGGNKSSGSFTSSVADEKIEFNESFKLSITLTKESHWRALSGGDAFQKNFLEFHLYDSKGVKQLGSASINLADYGVIEDTVAISAPIHLKKSTRSSLQPVLYLSIQSFDKDKHDDDESVYNDDDSVYNDDDATSVHSSQTTSSNSAATTHSNEKVLKGIIAKKYHEIPDDHTRTEPLKDIKGTRNLEPAHPISGENTAAEPGKYPSNSEVHNKTESEKDSKKTVNRKASRDDSDISPVAEEFYDSVNSISEAQPKPKSVKDTDPDTSSGAVGNSDKKTTGKSIKHLSNITLKSITESGKDKPKTVNVDPAVSSGSAFANSDKHPVAESVKHLNNIATKSTTESAKDKTKTVNMEPAVSSGAVKDGTKTVNTEPAVSSGAVKDGTKTVNTEPAVSSGDALANSDKHLVAESIKNLKKNTARNTTESAKDKTKTVNMEPPVSSGAAVADSIKHLNKITAQSTTESANDRPKAVNTEHAVSSGAPFTNSDKNPNPVAESVKHQNKSKTRNTTESANESIEAPNIEHASNENSVALKHQNKSKVLNRVESGKDSMSKVLNRVESGKDSTGTMHVEHAPRSGAAVSDVDKVSGAEPSENQNNSSAPQSTVDMTSFRKIVERRKKASDGSAIVRKAAQQSKRASSFTAADLGMNSDSVSFSESQITHEDDTKALRPSKDSTTSSSSNDVPEKKNKTELQKNGQDKQEIEVKEKSPEDEQLSEPSHSTKKGFGSWAKNHKSSKNLDQGGSVPNENLKDMKARNLSFNSEKSNGQSRNKELRVRSMENDVPEDTRTGSKSPTSETKGTKNDFPESKDGLKSENEILKEELREAAAVEVALYSVVAEHGNSVNKVHAPARRLSRFYFHACKEGSRSKMAGAARTSISGLILVARACGNDVPRLTFWLSNSIVLRATVCQASGSLLSSSESKMAPRRHKSFREKDKNNGVECFEDWENIHTFIAALEKVEGWIFSRIVESVWWQTLTPYMQSAVARKTNGKTHALGDPDQVNFSIDLWEKAFKDACERLCPIRAGGLQCGCLTVLARLVMEQLVNRLDVAMFNAILRDSDEEMPTDPLSDPISDPRVLPVPAGKTSFGAGAQLKSSIGNWSRWLTDLFGIDDDPSVDNSEPYVAYTPKSGPSFKPFYLLKSLSDLLMLPFDLLTDGSTRQEVCPYFGAQLIKKVLTDFVPDQFCPDHVPDSVFEVLESEVFLEVGKEYITSVPCSAAPTVYSPPKAAALKCIIGEFGGHSPSHAKGASLLRKAYASDDELDELDSPIKSISIDCIRVNPSSPTPKSKGKVHQKAVRYRLLREVWEDEN